MTLLLPSNSSEAFQTFLETDPALDVDDPDTPPDCHNHCTHFETEGECCDCGAQKPIPIKTLKDILPTLKNESLREDEDDLDEGYLWGV